jgi:hypothetical protein
VSPFLLSSYFAEHSTVKFVKKAFGGKNVEVVLQRLDRLTQDEVRTTAAQIFEVVHGLVQGMRVVMDGEQTHSACSPSTAEIPSLEDGKGSLGDVREALGKFIKDNKLIRCLNER